MKSSFIITAILSAIAGQALAATSYNFDSTAIGSLFTDSVLGWSQPTPNPPSVGGFDHPMAYIVAGDTGNAGLIGTLLGNTPANTTTTLIGSIADAGAISGKTVSLTVAILDDATDAYTTRDSFSISIMSSPTLEIASLLFTPNAGNPALWDISYDTGTGTDTLTASTVEANSNYAFFLAFTDTGIRFTYGTAADGVGTNLIGDVITDSAEGEDFSSINIEHNPLGVAGSSADALAFDNINVGGVSVPEPTSALLLGVASLGLLRRRRA